MELYQLEHALRAAKDITGEQEFIVIGASSIFASVLHPSPVLTATQETDLYPRLHPEKAVQLNCIGEMSPFHSTHGFYVDAVGPETAKLPVGWENRLIAVSNENTNHAIGWCLEVHDLAVSKLIAGREKDCSFVEELFRCKLISFETVRERLPTVKELTPEFRAVVQERLENVHHRGNVEEVLKQIRTPRPSKGKQSKKSRGLEIGDD